MVDAQADTIIAAKPQDKLSGVNKSIALYGNSYTHYNNNINTRLRDLSRSLLPNGAKDYMFRGITISSGRLGWHLPNLEFQNTLQKWDVVIFQGNSTEPFSAKKIRVTISRSPPSRWQIWLTKRARVWFIL